jgi:hypothetical protein
VLTPKQMSAAESLLAPPVRALVDFVTRHGGRRIMFGARPADVLRAAAAAAGGGGSGNSAAAASAALAAQRGAAAGEYIVALDPRGRVLVALAHGAPEDVALRAYVHALFLARFAGAAGGPARARRGGSGSGGTEAGALMAAAERWMGGATGCDALLRDAAAAGWRTTGPSLPRPAWTGKWV